jgi:hypothetical protein
MKYIPFLLIVYHIKKKDLNIHDYQENILIYTHMRIQRGAQRGAQRACPPPLF